MAAVDGGWSDWTMQSGCSLTCGDGVEVWVRECNNPSPGCNGQDCQPDADGTDNFKLVPCNDGECPNTCEYNGVTHTNGEEITMHPDANTCVKW